MSSPDICRGGLYGCFCRHKRWYYEWNKKKNLDWFVENSGLNSVELNASFYRFPFPGNIKNWGGEKGKGLRWSVKVHRSITHWRQFSESALEIWENFRGLFKPMDHLIDFYLSRRLPGSRRLKEPSNLQKKLGLAKGLLWK